jgi:hypothetical protein
MISAVTILIITGFEAPYTALCGEDHRCNWFSHPENVDVLIVVLWLERFTYPFQQILITLIFKIWNHLACKQAQYYRNDYIYEGCMDIHLELKKGKRKRKTHSL